MTCRKCVISVKRVRSIRLVIYQQHLECQKLAVEQLLLRQAVWSVRAGDTDVHCSIQIAPARHSSTANSVADSE
jgi:hypothetical protein